jgi:hypothetical protein
MSLAVADLVVGVFVMPISAIYVLTGNYRFYSQGRALFDLRHLMGKEILSSKGEL